MNAAPDEELGSLTDAQVLDMIRRERDAGNLEQMERAFAESGRRLLWECPRRHRLPRCPTCGRRY